MCSVIWCKFLILDFLSTDIFYCLDSSSQSLCNDQTLFEYLVKVAGNEESTRLLMKSNKLFSHFLFFFFIADAVIAMT